MSGNTIGTCVVLSMIASAAMTAAISAYNYDSLDRRISEAYNVGISAATDLDRFREKTDISIDGALLGAQAANASAIESAKQLESMREELDAMQTQIRLLKLR